MWVILLLNVTLDLAKLRSFFHPSKSHPTKSTNSSKKKYLKKIGTFFVLAPLNLDGTQPSNSRKMVKTEKISIHTL